VAIVGYIPNNIHHWSILDELFE